MNDWREGIMERKQETVLFCVYTWEVLMITLLRRAEKEGKTFDF